LGCPFDAAPCKCELIPKCIHVRVHFRLLTYTSVGYSLMSNLIIKQANGIALAQGITAKDITAAGALLIKDVKAIGKRADDITIAHALHIMGQKHYQDGGKGDTSAMQDW